MVFTISIDIILMLKLYLIGGMLAIMVGVVSKFMYKLTSLTMVDWLTLFLSSYVGFVIILYRLVVDLIKRR